MSQETWTTDKFPEPYKKVLLYDLYEGKVIGFWDIRSNRFFDLNSSVIGYVAGWCDLPEDLKASTTLIDNIRRNSYRPKVFALKREEDG